MSLEEKKPGGFERYRQAQRAMKQAQEALQAQAAADRHWKFREALRKLREDRMKRHGF